MRTSRWSRTGLILALTALSACAPASSPSAGSVSKGLVVTEIKSAGVSASQSRAAVEPRKIWRSATEYDNMTANDVEWLGDNHSYPNALPNHTLIAQYDDGQTWNNSLPLVHASPHLVGGGLHFRVQEEATGKQAPVAYVNGNAQFTLETGVSYYAYVDFYLDGADNTEMDMCGLGLPFVASGNDTLSFSVTDTDVALYVNGVQRESNVIWFGENAAVAAELGTSHNLIGENPEGRSAWRKLLYEYYGGDGKVAEFLLP